MRVIRRRASFISPLAQNLDRARVVIDRKIERFRHRVRGNVVVGGPDAAGRENVSVAGTQRIEGGNDLGLLIGNDADFFQVDPNGGHMLGDKADILVPGAARQDLVANNKNSGGDDLAFHDALLVTRSRAGHRQNLHARICL
jgi:hypothetical protein